MVSDFKITEEPFSWNNNFSEVAIEDFKNIQQSLPYCTCQTIGMALAKLELLEQQGCIVGFTELKDDDFDEPMHFTKEQRDWIKKFLQIRFAAWDKSVGRNYAILNKKCPMCQDCPDNCPLDNED